MKKCSFCSGLVADEATVCPMCGQSLVCDDATRPVDATAMEKNFDTVRPSAPSNIPPVAQSTGSGKKSLIVKILIAVVAFAALGAGAYFLLGAKSSSQLLKMIPAETDLVMTVDGKQILQSAGCKLSADGLELPRAIEKIMKNMSNQEKEIFDEIAQAKCFNIDQVVYALNLVNDTEYSDHNPDVSEGYMLISITNKEEVKKFFENLDDEFDFDDENGYEVSKIGWRDFIVVDDEYCWIYVGSRHVFDYDYEADDDVAYKAVVKRIEKIKNEANKKSIADVSYKSNILSDGNAAALIFDSKNLSDILGIEWGEYLGDKKYNELKVGVVANLEKESISLKAKLYDKDGGELEWSPGFGEINSSLAKYLNDNDMLVVAGSIDPDFSWEKYLSFIEEKTGEKMPKEIRSEYLKWMSALKGTIMYSVGFDSLDKLIKGDFTGLNCLAIVEMKDGKAKEAIDEISKLAALTGGEYIKKEGSALVLNADKFKFKLEEIDGNLILSNREIKEAGNEKMPNSFFDGKASASKLNIKKDSEIATLLDFPGNSSLELTFDKKELVAKLTFEGITEEAGILEFFISKINKYISPDFQRKIEDKFDLGYGNDYGVDYGVESIATDTLVADSVAYVDSVSY